MNKNSLLITTVIAALLISSIVLLKRRGAPEHYEHGPRFKIGIIQTASHPALDAVREGFVERIQETLGTNVEFVVNNAQGSIADAHTIAKRMHADTSINAVLAIATPAAQAIAQVEKEKPIIIAAVTDPQAAGLMRNTNICGSSDMIDLEAEITMLQELAPAARTIGLIYNTAEINAVTQIKLMQQILTDHGLTPILFGFTSEADMPAMVTTACQKSDALLAPNDNTIASSIKLIAVQALQKQKSLFVCDNLLIQHGALASRGINYHEGGKQAAEKALLVLVKGKKPNELPMDKPIIDTRVINKKVAQTLQITIPTTSKDKIEFVE